MKKLWTLLLLLTMAGMLMGQSASATYTAGDIPTMHGTPTDTTFLDNPETLTVTIPEGATITSVDISYDMTAASGAWRSEQRSRVRVANNNVAETQYLSGVGTSEGTYSYNRTGLDIANGVTATEIIFEMHAYRTWGGSGLSTEYNKVDNNTWTVTVHYTLPGAPTPATNPNPDHLANNIPVNGDLTWTWGNDTTTYDLWFGPAGNMVQVVTGANASGTTGSYSYTNLVNDTVYNWKVVSQGDGSPAESPVWSFTTALPDGLIEIGNGIITTLNLPINPNFGFNYSQNIYLQSEINVSDKQISKLYYNWNGAAAGPNSKDWVIYLGHTDKVSFSTTTDWIPLSSLSQVFNGEVSLPATAGWIEINLDIPFIYNNIDNLVIAIDENTPNYDPFSAKFFGTSFPTNRGIRYINDTINPNPASPPTGTLVAGIANIRIQTEDVPANPVFIASPTVKNFGTQIINTVSEQLFTVTNAGGGTLTVSDISISGYSGFTLQNLPTFPANLTTAQNTTFKVQYAPTSAGSHTATVTITHNAGRTTFDIEVEGICVDPTIVSFPYTENFDTVTAPALPLGWGIIKNSTSTLANVDTYSIGTPFSSPNHLRLSNSADNTATLIASTPIIQNINTKRVKFYAKGGVFSLLIGTMSDQNDPASFELIETVTISGTYTEYMVELTGANSNHLAFKHGLGGTYRTIYIDDVLIEEIPSTPIFSVTPATKDFGTVNINTESAPQIFAISNTGAGQIVINPGDITIAGENANQFILTNIETTQTLNANESFNVSVKFAPTSVGQKSATLNIQDNIVRTLNTVTLTGNCIDPNYGGGNAESVYGGYYFANSLALDAPSKPTYDWIDPVLNNHTEYISWTTDQDDAVSTAFDYNFTLYGVNYTQLYFNTNGLITLGATSTSFSNATIPSSATPNAFIALFWDDMKYFAAHSKIYTHNDNGNFIITYLNLGRTGSWNATAQITAQVILYANGNIKMQYKEIIGTVGATGSIHTATIGIENADGTKGVQYHFNGVGGQVIDDLAIMFGQDAATLPVELSSFSATMTANEFVAIMWTSESESNLRGYHVLRANDNDLASAIRITPSIITATNTSSTAEYRYEDREVAQATEYFYWLQSIENDGTMEYFGPVSIKTADAEIVPQLPQMTVLGNVYPNPFRTAERANFDIAVKEGETATLRIFNVKGQVVKQFDNLNPGKHTPQWDGKDMANRNVASGIYFYQLTSPSTHSVKKMVIIK